MHTSNAWVKTVESNACACLVFCTEANVVTPYFTCAWVLRWGFPEVRPCKALITVFLSRISPLMPVLAPGPQLLDSSLHLFSLQAKCSPVHSCSTTDTSQPQVLTYSSPPHYCSSKPCHRGLLGALGADPRGRPFRDGCSTKGPYRDSILSLQCLYEMYLHSTTKTHSPVTTATASLWAPARASTPDPDSSVYYMHQEISQRIQ